MRAVLCREWGPPESLVIEDLPSPEPGKDEVVISVRAANVSFANILAIAGRHQNQQQRPFSPGGEVAGVIKAVGENVSAFMAGDAVVGLGKRGGCAEEVIASAASLRHIPAGMDFKIAVASGSSYSTSLYALRERGRLQPGETLLVLGASGGVGLAAVELGKLMGARVIACASTQEKLDLCQRYGADELINYQTENLRDAVKRLTGDQGVDVVYDPVGGDYAEPALRGMAWGGRYLVVGFAAGAIPKIPLNLALLKGCSIVGVWIGGLQARDPAANSRFLDELMNMVQAGTLKPCVSAAYSLDHTVDALNDLKSRKVTGKIVIVP